ncbi:MAG: hypothetical protein Q4A52_06295, partial [Bacillota bacterium]|nr:hypothetical protein [Bacillota bacterium]
RNNRTSEEHPQGIFHPHAEYHHIKRENIGLIEVMGLAVLPGRLVNEMEEIAGLLSTSSPIEESNPHCRWAAEGMKRFRGAPVYKEILGHLYQEIGSTYGKLLEDSGIFKGDTRGVERFLFSVFGVEVTRYHQLNCGEAHIEIASLGAAMRRFTLDGEDVLHGYANPADYRTNPNNVNCVIAPNAGRIEGARLGDRVLDANEGENNLHSGFANTKYFAWNEEESSEDRLVLSYCHPHGFGGFDGCIELRAEWKLAADHLEFVITGRGPCGTHLNATNHNYYRLAPEAKVSVRADRFLRAGEGNIPREPLALSDHARYDLRSPREYREILETTGGIDHVYLLSFEDGERTQQAATIECAGHLLSFYSEQEAVVVYTANHDFCTHRGICLEFQGVPNREHPMRDGTYSNQLMIQWGRQQNESNVRQSGDRPRLL